MSIFFDFDVGQSGRRFRRAVDGDKGDIQLLLDSTHLQLFGPVEVCSLIELATLPICMINERHEILGFMALDDHPNVPGVDPAHWEMWMRNLYQKFYLARNTLFIHLMCCSAEAESFFMEEALISVFRSDSYILQIVLMIPPACPEDCYLKHPTFRKRNVYKCRAEKYDDVDCGHFYTALRRDFCPKLKVRRAVEEDNDDILAFLHKKCPKLKQLYGDYYISEIIGRHPEMKREVIVAECQTVAAGVMCLNSEINYDVLQKTYELVPYHGLRKTTAFEKEKNKRSNNLLKTFGEPIMLGNWSPFKQIPKCESAPIDDEPSKEKLVETKCPKTLSKVNFKSQTGSRRSMDFYLRQQSSDDMSDKISLNDRQLQSRSELSVADLLEEEPFDYEIVNIDSNLFTVPEVLSYDGLLYSENLERTQSVISQTQTKMKRRISNYKKIPLQESMHSTYGGAPDAFMIELFGFREDIDERHGFDLLEAAFEVMKQFDYCIIRVPCADNSFPLLQHFCFVPCKGKVCSKYALYIAHRNSVVGKLRVRRAEFIDIPQIAHLMQSLDGKETIWTVEDTILKRNELNAYVFFSGVSLVGVGIMGPPEHIDFVRAKFNMDLYHIHKYHFSATDVNAGFSMIKAVLAYPVFEPHFRFFIRDMMRQSDIRSVLWLTGYRNKWVIHKINSLAPLMIPLLPRKFELEYENIEDLKNIVKLSNTLTSFSAWFMNKSMTSVPRVNIDTRIVIVGASRAAMSFINRLLFRDTCSYLFFTNVTLISKNGLPYIRYSKTGSDTMFLKRQSASDKYLKSVPYTYYLNIIQGTMVEINKKEKFIKLSNDSKCYYDMLFLLTGKQYQHPGYLSSALERERSIRLGTYQYTRLDDPQHHELLVSGGEAPENVFTVNCMTDANKAIKFVNNLRSFSDDYKIIVYGASIHAYCCLATLLELKIPGEKITFVEPFPPKNPAKTRVSLFCNDYVDSTIQKMLDGLKVEVYRSYYFHTWTVDLSNYATHVEFLSNFKLLRLDCSAFFYYGKRSIDEQAFIAINKSGMAYDGGIAIDHEFRTQDPAVYAAGPATRYNRRYCADAKRHKYYDSTEVGDKLGSQIRNQLDPLFTENREKSRKQSVIFSTSNNVKGTSCDDIKDSVCQDSAGSFNRKSSMGNEIFYQLPEFTKPRVTSCLLPRDLQYLEVRPPALKTPHHYVQSLQYSGYVMETYKTGYFKLHLTKDLIVDGITCLTPEKYSLEIFKNLYGLSAVVLNNVHLRYMAKKLDDFYEFFRAPWAVFLYHDQTHELFAMVKELLPKGEPQGDTLRDGLRSVARKLSNTHSAGHFAKIRMPEANPIKPTMKGLAEGQYHDINFNFAFRPKIDSFTADTKLIIRSNFEKSPHIAAVAEYVLEWVSQNDFLLPVYFQPSHSGDYARDVSRNPAFRKRKRRLTKLLSAIY